MRNSTLLRSSGLKSIKLNIISASDNMFHKSTSSHHTYLQMTWLFKHNSRLETYSFSQIAGNHIINLINQYFLLQDVVLRLVFIIGRPLVSSHLFHTMQKEAVQPNAPCVEANTLRILQNVHNINLSQTSIQYPSDPTKNQIFVFF